MLLISLTLLTFRFPFKIKCKKSVYILGQSFLKDGMDNICVMFPQVTANQDYLYRSFTKSVNTIDDFCINHPSKQEAGK